jgi:thioredoxin-like negative regulator of GroEL
MSAGPNPRDAAIDAHRAGDHKTAIPLYSQWLAQNPDDASMWSNYGALLRSAKQFQLAEQAHRRALALEPTGQGIRANLANVLSDLGKMDESIALRRSLLEENPNLPEQVSLIGRCLRGSGRYDEAIEWLSPAVDQFPDYSDIRMQLALAQMAAGDYDRGFENYRVRWDTDEVRRPKINLPEWDGEPLEGKTVLVLPEQGFGDAVLMARHLPDLKAMGAKVILIAEKPLLRLFSKLPGADVVSTGIPAQTKIDFYISMMDLPRLAVSTDDDIRPPTEVTVPDTSKDRAAKIVAPYRNAFKIGVVWSGSATYRGNAFRSFTHREFWPLLDIENTQLFSLYKGPYLDAFQQDGSSALIVDAASTDRDFADCAATMLEMDLIITSDTATAHIAGSLGVPTWVILHTDAFWVYRHHGETTPWYPTMRLFRQEQALEWAPVINTIKQEVITWKNHNLSC